MICRWSCSRAGAAACGAALLAACPAHAHIVSSRLGDFYAGMIHPLTGTEDVVLWTALGLAAGMQEPRQARWVVPALPAGLLSGAGLASVPPPPPLGALLDAGAMVVIGLLVALAATLRGPLLALLAGSVGVWRGVANVTGLGNGTSLALFISGLVLSGYALTTLIGAAALAFRGAGQEWRGIVIRACGSWIAAVGCMLGVFALRDL